MLLNLQITSEPSVLVLMGVSGCGKTTIAAILASRLGWPFEEGDALHPQANIEKMAAGHPLTDADRWPWLAKVADWIDERLDAGENGLITCSALKRSYRDLINRRGSGLIFVFWPGQRRRSRHGWPHATTTSCARACLTASSPISRNPPRMSRQSELTSGRRLRRLPSGSSKILDWGHRERERSFPRSSGLTSLWISHGSVV